MRCEDRPDDGWTDLAYKTEHAVDLDSGVIVAAPSDPDDEGDTTTLPGTLEIAARNLAGIGLAPSVSKLCVLVGNKSNYWRENKLFIFGDALMHQSLNETNKPRFCLFVDIIRLTFLMGVLKFFVHVIGMISWSFQFIFNQHWKIIEC